MPIEPHAPGLARLVNLDQTSKNWRPGRRPRGPAEGPLWWHEGGYLLFSDIGNNRRMKWSPDERRQRGPGIDERSERPHTGPPGTACWPANISHADVSPDRTRTEA